MSVPRNHRVVVTEHGGPEVLQVVEEALPVPRHELRNQFFQFRVWDAEDLIDELLDIYDQVDEEIRNKLILKPIWIVDDGGATRPASGVV